jgi:UPF0716 protein FxsA
VGKFLLLFAALPLVDLFVLIRLGKAFGGGVPLALVLVSGLCGAWLMRTAGQRVTGGWRAAVAEQRSPDDSVLSGALLLLGCALLIMPGVISDVFGLSLLIPGFRRRIAQRVGQRMFDAIQQSGARFVQMQEPFPAAATPRRSIIDVEAEVIESNEQRDDGTPKQLKP